MPLPKGSRSPEPNIFPVVLGGLEGLVTAGLNVDVGVGLVSVLVSCGLEDFEN